MTFVSKPGGWQNGQAGGTPLNATGLNDLESRVGTAIDSVESSKVSKTAVSVNGTDYATVQDWLTASAGRSGFLPQGTYSLSSAVTLSDGVVLEGEGPGTVLDFSSAASGTTLLSILGTEGTAVNLTSNATAGGTTLAMAAGAESVFTAGAYVKVGSTAQFDFGLTDSEIDQRIGEINRVLSTSSGSVTLAWPLADSYATADTAFVAPLTMREGIVVRNLTIKGGGTGKNHIGATFDRCRAVRLENVRFENCDAAHVRLWDCIDTSVHGITVMGGTSASTQFYGVSMLYACQDITVSNSTFRDVRHAVTCGGSTARSGINRRITVIGNHAYDTTASSFDTHGGCEDIQFIGNTSYNAIGQGIQCRNPSTVISGNTIVRASAKGIWLRNQTNRDSSYTVQGNRVVNAATIGIHFSADSADSADHGEGSVIAGVAISGNTVIAPGDSGIQVSSATPYAARMHSVSITGNTVRSATNRGIYVLKAQEVTVNGNVITNQTNTVDAIRLNDVQDSTVAGNVCSFASIGTGRALFLLGCTDIAVTGNRGKNALVGVTIDAASTNCVLLGNNMRGCTTPISNLGGATNILTTADAAGAYNRL